MFSTRGIVGAGAAATAASTVAYSATPQLTVPQLFRSAQLRGGSTSVAPTDKLFWIYLSPSMHVRLHHRISFYGGYMYLKAGHIVFLTLISGVLPHAQPTFPLTSTCAAGHLHSHLTQRPTAVAVDRLSPHRQSFSSAIPRHLLCPSIVRWRVLLPPPPPNPSLSLSLRLCSRRRLWLPMPPLS